MSEILVTVRDCRTAKMCRKGTKIWFKKKDLNFDDFVQNGISSKILEDLNDAMALKVVEVAHGRRK